ncbi:MAG TPA: trypsin-like peptidase domain-containing protein [Gemmatimonadales bacterium]|nr:trypsin-like peptidase domain-containing protein [Gemmatimonadales bacterium]
MSNSSQGLLQDLSNALASAVERAARAVVSVHARPRLPSSGVHWRDGIVVTTDGTIRRTDGITVTLPDGKSVSATLRGRDAGTDLAVLSIPAGLLPVADVANEPLSPGHLVLALGRIDDSGPRSSFGAVSSTGGPWRSWKGGEIEARLQSDLTIYPGLGGGPLVDVGGRVHGINSGGLSRGLATTLPVKTVERVLAALLTRGYVARGYLGAALQPVRFSEAAQKRIGLKESGGLVILEVDQDGPAAAGGLMLGDVVISANGHGVENPEDLLRLLTAEMVGRSLKLDLVRAGSRTSAEILVGERPRRSA